MSEIKVVPQELTSMAPTFSQLAEGFHRASGQIAGPLGAAESAARNHDIASAVADFTAQWSAGMTKLAEAMTAADQALVGTADGYSNTDNHVASGLRSS